MKSVLIVCAFTAVLAASAGPASAHHGTGISYDLEAPLVTLKGTVTEWRWANPHVSLFLDVKDAEGKVVNWGIEHSNVNTLARQGYNRNTLKSGQEVTVVVHPSRAGAPIGLTVKVILSDGKEILQRNQAGAPEEGER